MLFLKPSIPDNNGLTVSILSETKVTADLAGPTLLQKSLLTDSVLLPTEKSMLTYLPKIWFHAIISITDATEEF